MVRPSYNCIFDEWYQVRQPKVDGQPGVYDVSDGAFVVEVSAIQVEYFRIGLCKLRPSLAIIGN